MGSDLSVVNAARVSFGKQSSWANADRAVEYPGITKQLKEADQRLIQFLARGCTTGDWEKVLDNLQDLTGWGFKTCEVTDLLNHVRRMPTHWTPFGHTAITLHIKAPIFVARQLGKHQVGMVWNEVSRRYVTSEPEFYEPEVWRKAAENVKQGSNDEPIDASEYNPAYLYSAMLHSYRKALDYGVCPEQARMILPQSMYTEWYWTGNLYSFANVYIQRTDSHAQREVQEVARQIGKIVGPHFPVSWEALTK